MYKNYPGPHYYIGLDLGQSKDFTAMCILEMHGERQEAIFHARHLQRYQLGTSYPAIVADVAAMLRRPLFKDVRPTLAVDGTGVGAAVVDLFRKEKLNAHFRPIIITGGDVVTYDSGVTRVPKRDLVGVTQVALQTSRLKIAADLPDAQTLVNELQNFQVKITTAANDTYGAWREGTHDDLVLAVSMALWTAMNTRTLTVASFRI
ncbi:MAG: hypothetical protein ACREEM_54490 [Blastocatellia bacterium]